MTDGERIRRMLKSIEELVIIGETGFFKVKKKSTISSAHVRKEANGIYASKGHDKDTHRRILSLYSECIALAPPDSEELALGYSNRSALLKHLGKYEEAIVDVERALKYANKALEAKLSSRKSDCLKLIDAQRRVDVQPKLQEDASEIQKIYRHINQMYKKVDRNLPDLPDWKPAYGDGRRQPLPSVKMSELIPYLADCATVEYDEKHGRHIVASRDIDSCEIVAIEPALVSVPRDHQQYLVCSHCLNFAWNALACDSCVYAVYCSERCKDAAWEEYHDEECKILPYLYRIGEYLDSSGMRLATRLFLVFAKRDGLSSMLKDFEAVSGDESDASDDKQFSIDRLMSDPTRIRSFRNFITMYEGVAKDASVENSACSLILRCLIEYTSVLDADDVVGSETKEDLVKRLIIRLKSILNGNVFMFKMKANLNCECKDAPGCSEKCEKVLGTAYMTVCSFFNHSCVSNTGRFYADDGRVVLYTVRPVERGEQLCIDYGTSMFIEKSERSKRLMKNCAFSDCHCQACSENWPVRSVGNAFQDIFADPDKGLELYKLLCEENINLLSLYDFDVAYCSEKILRDNAKVMEMAYKSYPPLLADTLTDTCAVSIQEIFDGLYGYEAKIPSACQ